MATHCSGNRRAGVQGMLSLMLALLFLTACGGAGTPPVAPTATIQAPRTQVPGRTPSVTQVTPTPGPIGTPTPEPNIIVESPKSGEEVRSSVTVKGKARVFEATLEVALKDAQGNEIGRVVTMAAEGAPGWGDFQVKIPFTTSSEKQGVVEAFSRSARDGSIINLVRVPVKLVPG